MTRPPLLPDLFAGRAAQEPDAVAVLEGHQETGYARLARTAEQLSRSLTSRGIRRGSRVGLGLPAGSGLLASLLAVWSAGAAVVLRDDDTDPHGPDLLLTPEDVAAPPRLTPDAGIGTRDRAESGIAGDDPALVLQHRDGAPDTVISHAAAAAHVRWLLDDGPGFSGTDRLLLPPASALAGAIWECLAALVSGAPLVAVDPTASSDTAALARVVAERRITVLVLPGTTVRRLVEEPGLQDCTAVRLVLAEGPGLDAATAYEMTLGGAATLWHTFGSTTLGTTATAHLYDPERDLAVLPLGRPLPGRRVTVVDEFGEPVPPGVPGDLLVDGVATGEPVRRRNDGSLDHLGRTGHGTPGPDGNGRYEGGEDPAAYDAPGGLLLGSARPAHIAPDTPSERLVAAVWSEILETDGIGVDDDFFQLGGYSLQMPLLAERLLNASGIRPALSELYTAVTVRGQAALLDAGGDRTPPVTPVPRDDRMPLSFGQRRLWFLDRMHAHSPEWVVPMLLRVPEEVTAATVRQALDALAVRHESLRTRYEARGDEPVQVIEKPRPVELRVVDAPEEDPEPEVRRAFETGFDLASGTPWRALLVRRPGEAHTLLVTVHHIACDGWSSTVLEREFRTLCADLHAGRTPSLAPAAVQYADYASWQRAWHGKERLGPDLDFWRAELADLTPLELPADHVRPPERDPRGGLVRFTVPARVAEPVAALGRSRQATPFMTWLTAFSTLLARYSGQWDVPIGVPVAGRTASGVEDVVGFFLNSLVLRCRPAADRPFSEALRDVRATALAAFAHQEVSFEHLVEELRPERDLSRTPLYQVAFNFNDDEVGGGMPDPGDGDMLLRARQVAKTDLTLYLRREPGGELTGVLEYATALFEAATVERLARHFVTLLESVAAQPRRPVAALDILPADERAGLLTRWNDTATPLSDASVLDLVEERAAADGDAVAVVVGEQRMTFRELDAQATRVAHRLVAAGAGPGGLVGVCLHRGPDLIPALLGVWKAGAAYLPLDPANPGDRLVRLLRDSGARVLLTASALDGPTAAFDGTRILLDRERADIAARPVARLPRPTDPQQAAYVIYTSGSTGTPKGVVVTQRGLANHLTWAARELIGGSAGGAPLFSSIAFDLPATNVYAPLITGRPVHVLAHDADAATLGPALVAGGPYSFIKLTPGHLELLSHQLTGEQAAGLAEIVLVAGEELPARTADHWLGLLGPGRLINEYGPTEASIGSTVHPVDAPHSVPVPLGLPLPNTTAHVLDGAGEPVPLGVIGELFVGGAGVARGYLDRPRLTAERFVPDPYGTPGARLYRTGDLALRRPDGSIVFRGRTDHQVKLRGYRIEPGEVQARLAALPGVRDAVVVVTESSTGEKSLSGYLVPEDGPGGATDTRRLRELLTEELPEYMVPAALTVIDAVPLTANGKLDRAALPAATTAAATHTAPEGPTEELIAALWAELLGRERIGSDDNFFEVGGHSILAIRMAARLQDTFDIDLSVRTVFEQPTVGLLAQAVESAIRAEIDQLSDAELTGTSTAAEGPAHE
ncbi:amino acid adenylation domain-containing protein [Streptomyces sp. NPDC096324]|uniref:amino acid adenylation domain-containing protein n=1 Tax=Streptomyces sp. NPDC096324 TaxID=3366085 RepID=UPI00380BFEC7